MMHSDSAQTPSAQTPSSQKGSEETHDSKDVESIAVIFAGDASPNDVLTGILETGLCAALVLPDNDGLADRVEALNPVCANTGTALILDVQAQSFSDLKGTDGVAVPGTGNAVHAARKHFGAAANIISGPVQTRHDAMLAGEAEPQAVIIGPGSGDAEFERDALTALTQWWVELFELPAIAMAQDDAHVSELLSVNADFVGISLAHWPAATPVDAQRIIAAFSAHRKIIGDQEQSEPRRDAINDGPDHA